MAFVCPPGCGQCCGIVIFDLATWEKHKCQAIDVDKVKVFDDQVVPTRKVGGCVFLDRQKRCLIYEDRPEVCRKYGESCLPCPILRPDGTRRSREEKRQMKEMIGRQVDEFLAYAETLRIHAA